MTNDEKKIMTHLLHRKNKADSVEIENAWEFENFNAALSSLTKKGYVKKSEYIDKNKESYYCRLTQDGIKALREVL